MSVLSERGPMKSLVLTDTVGCFLIIALLAATTAGQALGPRGLAQPSRQSVLTPIELARRALPSVVSILVVDAGGHLVMIGSGFFVRGDVLATNYHVIEPAANVAQITVKVVGKNEAYGIQEILGADEKKDLALLRVARIHGRPLPLGTTRQIEIGEAVYAVGTPKGLEGTFSQGIVSSIRQDAGQTFIQITAPVSRGSSGGPVLSSRGEVIGIIKMGIEEGQNLNFAIPAKYLTSLIRESLVTDKQTLAESYVDRGNRYREQKLFAKALEAYKQAITIQPDNLDAYCGLAFTYDDMLRYVEAVQAYKQAIRIAPDDSTLYHLLAFSYSNLGNVYALGGNYERAIDSYKQAIQLYPGAPGLSAYASLGDVFAKLGRDAETIDAYKQAIRIDPAATYRYQNLGDLLLKVGKKAEAIEAYKHAFRDSPEAHSYVHLGDVLLKLGRDAQATEAYNQAIDAYKQAVRIKADTRSYTSLGDVYRKLGRYSDALEAYKEVIRVGPVSDRADTALEMGLIYEALNRYAEAAEVYKKYDAKPGLGRVYYEMGSYDNAIEVFNEIIRTKPNYAYAHHMLGKVYLKLGRIAAAKQEQGLALRILKRAILASKSENGGAHLGLYNVYLELGDKASALSEYKTLERLTKDSAADLKDQLNFRRGEFYQ